MLNNANQAEPRKPAMGRLPPRRMAANMRKLKLCFSRSRKSKIKPDVVFQIAS
jgi:hypothetical protein